MKKIKLIIGSTRQGRVGKPVSHWLVDHAKSAGIDLEVLDLKEIDLPFFEAPVPPLYVPDSTPHGKEWAKMIDEADGFVFVTPEYNRSMPASLKNALDYLVAEWKDKPAAVVSYGYIDGGANATKHLHDVLGWLKIKNVGKEMSVVLKTEMFDESGEFKDVDAVLEPIAQDFVTSLKAIEKA